MHTSFLLITNILYLTYCKKLYKMKKNKKNEKYIFETESYFKNPQSRFLGEPKAFMLDIK